MTELLCHAAAFLRHQAPSACPIYCRLLHREIRRGVVERHVSQFLLTKPRVLPKLPQKKELFVMLSVNSNLSVRCVMRRCAARKLII